MRIRHGTGALLLAAALATSCQKRAHDEPKPVHASPVESGAASSAAPSASTKLAPFVPATTPDLGPVLSGVAARVPKLSYGTDVAVGVTWLPTMQRFVHRPEEPRVMASLGKFFWAAAALAKAPVDQVERYGIPAFAESDNEAGRMLIDLAGGADAVNLFTENELGIPGAQLSTCGYTAGTVPRFATNCTRVPGMDAFFTVAGALTFLEKLSNGDPPLDGHRRQKLLEWSKLAPVDGFSIARQLPKDVQLAMHHKRAEIPLGCCGKPDEWNWTAEIALIPTPRGWYAIAISLAHSATYANQLAAIEWASCVIWHAAAGDVPDPFDAGCVGPTGYPITADPGPT